MLGVHRTARSRHRDRALTKTPGSRTNDRDTGLSVPGYLITVMASDWLIVIGYVKKSQIKSKEKKKKDQGLPGLGSGSKITVSIFWVEFKKISVSCQLVSVCF